MESRALIAAVVVGLVALAAGFFTGRASVEPMVGPKAPVVATARSEAGKTRPDAADSTAVQKLREDLAQRDQQLLGWAAAKPQEHPAWPADPPTVQTPAGFWSVVRELKTTCETRFHFLGLECTEAPCIAMLRDIEQGALAKLNGCAAYTGVYPAPVVADAVDIACPNGGTETALLLSPADGADEASHARLLERRAWLAQHWTCSPSTPAAGR